MATDRIVLTAVSNAFWLWIIIWKMSFLIFHPIEVIQSPATLLYFDGGERGEWIASMVAAVYIYMKAAKFRTCSISWDNILVLYLLAGWMIYQTLYFIIVGRTAWLHGASAVFTAVLLSFHLYSTKSASSPKGSTFAVWFSIGQVILEFWDPDRSIWLLSFSKHQLFFLVVAMVFAGWSWLKEMKQRGDEDG
ncbi:hypothetical protein [Paenibacillus sp. FSL K6-2862]|uniref:hypothetical protein n=1 Tax=Paenibacillus sp. FSL K6-2862 TaxID=2921484 RepID=UPI0030F78BFC